MMKIICLAIFVACASALSPSIQGKFVSISKATRGAVPITLCSGEAGSGTAHELRVSGCDGAGCVVVPGTVTAFEGDFTPSVAAAAAQFTANAVVAGIPIPVADGPLGALNAGTMYRVTQDINISDALVGLTPIIRIQVTGDGDARIVCIETRVTIGNGQ